MLSAQMGQKGEAIPRCRLMVKGRRSKVVAILSGFLAADIVAIARWAGQVTATLKEEGKKRRANPCWCQFSTGKDWPQCLQLDAARH